MRWGPLFFLRAPALPGKIRRSDLEAAELEAAGEERGRREAPWDRRACSARSPARPRRHACLLRAPAAACSACAQPPTLGSCSTRAPPLAPSTRAGFGGSAGTGSERGRPEIPPPGRSSSSSRAATSSTGEAPPPEGRGRGRRRAMRARPPGQGRAAARAHGASPPGSRVGAADPVKLDAAREQGRRRRWKRGGREAHSGQLSAFSFCGQANGVVWEGERS